MPRKNESIDEPFSDTCQEMGELLVRRWKQRTPQERNMYAARMNAVARRIVIAAIGETHSEDEYARELYRRLYGEELPEGFLNWRRSRNNARRERK